MGRQFVTACVFCLLCSTSARCASHRPNLEPQLRNADRANSYSGKGGGGDGDGPQVAHDLQLNRSPHRVARGASDEPDYVKLIFDKFGDGDHLSRTGFVQLLDTLGLAIDAVPSESSNGGKNKSGQVSGKCGLTLARIPESGLGRDGVRELCPQILHQLVPELRSDCAANQTSAPQEHDSHSPPVEEERTSTSATWFYATLSVLLISLCGLLAVAVIPLMQKEIYHGILQFFVALAVGTLLGDALLHLLPHAMMSAHADHAHSGHVHDHSDEDQHTTNLLKGLVAALSAIFFYFTEKGLSLVTEWRKRHQRKNKVMTKVRVMKDDHSSHEGARVGEKLCKHKYSSYPYCYGEIDNHAECQPGAGEPDNKNNGTLKDGAHPKSQEPEGDSHKEEVPGSEKQLLETTEPQNELTIILREHETVHHGHSHTHGHVHSAPGSIKSVAWMVIMGDGIHNLTDGLAIGAAFAANIGGGLSTAVAVFCHELPHEIGDFAVLLRAGMSTKEAVVYNMISSILCLIGMSIGVLLGQNDHVKLWVFSAAAGMFLYIALVDMVPELTSNHSSDGSSACCQCLLQLLGLLSGVGIMLLIALYEHDLMTAFENSL